MDEALCIQDHLPVWRARKKEASSLSDTVFSKLVFAGKIQSAVKCVSEESSKGVLNTDQYVSDGTKTVLEILLEKHPEPLIPPAEALMEGEPVNVNLILFERLTPELIKNTCRRARGAAGRSGLDAEAWKRMITCFKQSSNRLCAALASAARCLCTEDLTVTRICQLSQPRG